MHENFQCFFISSPKMYTRPLSSHSDLEQTYITKWITPLSTLVSRMLLLIVCILVKDYQQKTNGSMLPGEDWEVLLMNIFRKYSFLNFSRCVKFHKKYLGNLIESLFSLNSIANFYPILKRSFYLLFFGFFHKCFSDFKQLSFYGNYSNFDTGLLHFFW